MSIISDTKAATVASTFSEEDIKTLAEAVWNTPMPAVSGSVYGIPLPTTTANVTRISGSTTTAPRWDASTAPTWEPTTSTVRTPMYGPPGTYSTVVISPAAVDADAVLYNKKDIRDLCTEVHVDTRYLQDAGDKEEALRVVARKAKYDLVQGILNALEDQPDAIKLEVNNNSDGTISLRFNLKIVV